MKYNTRTMSIAVTQEGDGLFSNSATTVSIEDESAGEFLKLSQRRDGVAGSILIDPEEWPHLKEAIETMFTAIKENEAKL